MIQNPNGDRQDPRANPVRIVPMRPSPREIEGVGLAAVQAVQPQLTYNGGPLLANVEVFTLFWGSDWANQSDLTDLSGQLNQFFQFIVTSPLIDQLAEYQVPAFPIGQGSFSGTLTLTDQDPGSQVTDQQIQDLLQAQTAAGGSLPPPDANLLYFVFLPPGVTVDLGGSLSCSVFCGYHEQIGGTIFYAVMPYPDCSGCQIGAGPLDSLTVTSSHELCEAITDPVPGQGWYWFTDANNQGEIGDICVGQTKIVGSYTVQTEWSNAAGQCV